jgi:hypothetical protein
MTASSTRCSRGWVHRIRSPLLSSRAYSSATALPITVLAMNRGRSQVPPSTSSRSPVSMTAISFLSRNFCTARLVAVRAGAALVSCPEVVRAAMIVGAYGSSEASRSNRRSLAPSCIPRSSRTRRRRARHSAQSGRNPCGRLRTSVLSGTARNVAQRLEEWGRTRPLPGGADQTRVESQRREGRLMPRVMPWPRSSHSHAEDRLVPSQGTP